MVHPTYLTFIYMYIVRHLSRIPPPPPHHPSLPRLRPSPFHNTIVPRQQTSRLFLCNRCSLRGFLDGRLHGGRHRPFRAHWCAGQTAFRVCDVQKSCILRELLATQGSSLQSLHRGVSTASTMILDAFFYNTRHTAVLSRQKGGEKRWG